MVNGPEGKVNSLQNLSALADGELDAAEVMQACAHWRSDAQLRAAWHAYHLIGDAMRSDELAADPARDAAFVQGLRARLAAEPVVLAPQPEDATATEMRLPSVRTVGGARWRPWMGTAAVAAGVMAVASVLVVTREPRQMSGPGDGIVQSATDPRAQATASVQTSDFAGDAQTVVADGKLIRDARLERYFAAHKQFGGSSALGVPSGFLRAATTQTPDR
jgi:sigma-E factor negative regulatory protein RseA